MSFDWTIFLDQLTSPAYLRGTWVAIIVSVFGLILACVVGFIIAVLRIRTSPIAQGVAATYTWFFRAMPAMLLLLLAWNALPQILPPLHAPWYTPLVAAIIALGLGEAAYMAEAFRAALTAVDEGQRTAARALGMNPLQSMFRVVLPQATRIALPSIGNQFVSLLKLSSIASVISLEEVMRVAMNGVQATYRYAEYYAVAAVYYLVLVTIAMIIQNLIERRFRWSTRVAQKPRRGIPTPKGA